MRGAVGVPSRADQVGWATLLTVGMGYLLVSWGMAPVSAILPTISADLQIDVSGAGWIMTSYFLLLVGTVLIAGRVGDLFGHRHLFFAGTLIFGLASIACGLSTRLEPLIVARSVQGIGAALVFGTSLALISEAVPAARRGMAIGTLSMSMGGASLLGVAFAVFAVQHLTWHWTFFIILPLWAAVLILARRLPVGLTTGSRAKVDWQGGILLFAALMVLMLSLNHFHEGEQSFQEGAFYHLPMHALALTLFAAFVWVETRVPQPLLALGMLRDVQFAGGIVANAIAHMSMLASAFVLPFLLERGRGYSPTSTGYLMLAMQITMLACSLLAGWAYDRTRSPKIGWLTMGAIASGLTVLGLAGAGLPFEALIGISALLGVGLGGFTTVNNTAVMGRADASKRGFASGMIEMTRQFGHSIGVSMSGSIMAGALAGVAAADLPLAYAAGFSQATLAMGILSGLGLLAIVVPTLTRRREAGPRPTPASQQPAMSSR